MTFRYIGSKSRLISQIVPHIGAPREGAYFVDAFCGTGVVAEAAAELGWNVRLNDNMRSAVTMAAARLICSHQVGFNKTGGYQATIKLLNSLESHEGFVYREYSPASLDLIGFERRYFTTKNAGRIDAVRRKIWEWAQTGLISPIEECLLIADLLAALNRVANIAGTFGCFLSKWTSQSQGDLKLRCRPLKSSKTSLEIQVGDVFDVVNQPGDVVYLDPPYTKRQYASYYHILETVALGDQPIVSGVGGLRPWKEQASEFCYKTRALATLEKLLQSLRANDVLLSYSSEGHIEMTEMKAAIAKFGKTKIFPLGAVGRYRPNRVASQNAAEVNEYLVSLDRVAETSTALKKNDEIHSRHGRELECLA